MIFLIKKTSLGLAINLQYLNTNDLLCLTKARTENYICMEYNFTEL